MKIRCWHSDSWVREDNMEICSSCGKELGKLVNKGNKSLSFSGTPKEASKPVESQQNLDNYVLQSNLEDNFSQKEKETISDIKRNEKADHLLPKKATIAAIVVIAIIAIVGGLFYYSYTQIHVSLDSVNLHSIVWTTFSWSTIFNLGLNYLTGNWLATAFELIDGVNLNLIFGLSNNGIFPVYIPDLKYDLYVNGAYVGEGKKDLGTTIYPGNPEPITISQNFKKSSLSPAVASIVNAGGVIELHVKGTAYFKLLGMTIPIPFESTRSISIIDEIKNRLNSEIQQNQQQQSSSLGTSIEQSLQNTFESIKNEITGIESNSLDLQPSKQTQGTGISLVVPYSTVSEGSTISISGRLTTFDGAGIPNVKVYIRDEDAGSGDDMITSLRTDSNGNFRYNWIAKSMDPFDTVVEIYAVFEGTQEFDSSRSNQFNLIVQEPVKFEPPPQIPSPPQTTFKQTSISLDIPYTSVKKGDFLSISGRLLDSDGKGVPGVTVYIKDEDAGSGDDEIAVLKTDSSGRFSVQWKAKSMDPFDSVVEIYAVFEGSSNFGNARSIQIDVHVN